jgi:hypothetical protein
MEDDDIPVLVDVRARPTAAPFVLTADNKASLITEIAPTLRAQLAAEMRDEIQAFIQAETQASQQNHQLDVKKIAAEVRSQVLEETATFVDKLKADLATDVPKMLHSNANLIESDLVENLTARLNEMQSAGIASVQSSLDQALPSFKERCLNDIKATLSTVETNTVMQASQALRDKMVAMDDGLFRAHQTKISESLNLVYEELTQKSQSELTVFVDALQLQSQQQLEEKLTASFSALYQKMMDDLLVDLKGQLTALAESTKTDFTEALNVRLPEIETALTDKVQAVLACELPIIQQHLSDVIQAEVKELLSSVRLSV